MIREFGNICQQKLKPWKTCTILRSQRAIQRIGAKKEGVHRKERIMWDGHVRDTIFYSIIDEDWPEVKLLL